MTINVLEQAIDSNDAGHAAEIIQTALSIESDQMANCRLPHGWPADRDERAAVIGEWLKTILLLD